MKFIYACCILERIAVDMAGADCIVSQLSMIISEKLMPLINEDYWLCEVPYYSNVGDALIWQGELDFLKKNSFRRKGMSSYKSLNLPSIGKGELVLFQGGGNFGDLWKEPHVYRSKLMLNNPTCRFVVFPQTVWYDNEDNLKADAKFYSKFNCTICARDRSSYELLQKYFKNEILLVPDMAFCIDMEKWNIKSMTTSRSLVLKRCDKELSMTNALRSALSDIDADVCDWPPIENYTLVDRVGNVIRNRFRQLSFMYEPYMYYVYRPYLIRSGIRLINSHTDIYTTRLHACILSLLLGKEKIVFFDNSYGKNRGFYESWLSGCNSVTMM